MAKTARRYQNPRWSSTRETNLVHVTLNVGDHPFVTKPHKFTFEYSKVNWSIDGLFYACLYPDENTLRCLYLPPPSF